MLGRATNRSGANFRYATNQELTLKLQLNEGAVQQFRKKCYTDIVGNRIGRLELLFWFVASVIGAGIGLAIASALTSTPIEPGRTRYPWSFAFWVLAVALVMLKAIMSRVHDIGWPGWAVVVIAVPLVDLIALLFLLLAPGQKQANVYGEPPRFLQRLRGMALS